MPAVNEYIKRVELSDLEVSCYEKILKFYRERREKEFLSDVPTMRSGHAVELSTVFNHPEEILVAGRAFDESFAKTMRKMLVQFAKTGNPSLSAEISPDGKSHEWPLYNLNDKKIMIFDEFNIHPEKESERKILDWERCYFLTKYFCI